MSRYRDPQTQVTENYAEICEIEAENVYECHSLKIYLINPYNAEIFLYKSWRPKGLSVYGRFNFFSSFIASLRSPR